MNGEMITSSLKLVREKPSEHRATKEGPMTCTQLGVPLRPKARLHPRASF